MEATIVLDSASLHEKPAMDAAMRSAPCVFLVNCIDVDESPDMLVWSSAVFGKLESLVAWHRANSIVQRSRVVADAIDFSLSSRRMVRRLQIFAGPIGFYGRD